MVLNCKANTVLSSLVRDFSLPQEGIIFLFQSARVWQTCLLKSGYVHVEPLQFVVDDSSLSQVPDACVVKVESGEQCPDVPVAQFKSWSFEFLVVSRCAVYRSAIWMVSPDPQAPSEDNRPQRDNALLAGGCPVKLNNLSHRRKQPLAPHSMPNE